ncbi:MAG: helix-turn-helix domain-containing protein [Patescibacteria group bacterium]
MVGTTYSKDYQNLIEKIKHARKEAGFSQAKLAKKLGKPQSFISKCESGERKIDPIELKKIAEILAKNINYFI